MNRFWGISVFDGIGIGSAFVVPEQKKNLVAQKKISEAELPDGWKRFEAAIASVTDEINSQQANLPKQKDAADYELLEAYLLMISDTVFFDGIKKYYEKNLCDISYALHVKTQEAAAQMQALDDAYLAARAQDIVDIFERVQNKLQGVDALDFSKISEGAVIVAASISPLDMIAIAQKKIAGLVMENDKTMSHTAILARYYEIPTVVGVEKVNVQIASGETVIVDGVESYVYASPNDNLLNEYREKISK